jgi:hypothetical protein
VEKPHEKRAGICGNVFRIAVAGVAFAACYVVPQHAMRRQKHEGAIFRDGWCQVWGEARARDLALTLRDHASSTEPTRFLQHTVAAATR